MGDVSNLKSANFNGSSGQRPPVPPRENRPGHGLWNNVQQQSTMNNVQQQPAKKMRPRANAQDNVRLPSYLGDRDKLSSGASTPRLKDVGKQLGSASASLKQKAHELEEIEAIKKLIAEIDQGLRLLRVGEFKDEAEREMASKLEAEMTQQVIGAKFLLAEMEAKPIEFKNPKV